MQNKIKEKKVAFKEWQTSGYAQKKGSYNREKTETKNVVAKAKWEAGIQFYDNRETKEGEAEIYKVAKQRTRAEKDVGEMTVIRNQRGDIETNEDKIKDRWAEYFNKLLNEKNEQQP